MIKRRGDEQLGEMGSKKTRGRGPGAYGEHQGHGLGAPSLPSNPDTEPLECAPSGPTPWLQHPGPRDSLPKLLRPDSRPLLPQGTVTQTCMHQGVAQVWLWVGEKNELGLRTGVSTGAHRRALPVRDAVEVGTKAGELKWGLHAGGHASCTAVLMQIPREPETSVCLGAWLSRQKSLSLR